MTNADSNNGTNNSSEFASGENARHDFPYPSHYIDIKGSKMHFVEKGVGDPILFLHGQPTWSYLWRNVMPELEGNGRLIALDLIGYGKSDKPDIGYEMTDHIEYIQAFIEKMGLKNITLVIHDWGSYFGAHYAMSHPENVKGIAFMEALLLPISSYDAFEPHIKEFFVTLRSSQKAALEMMVDKNLFIESVLPALIDRKLTEDEWDAYREPFKKPEDRKILCKFPQNLVIGGQPRANYDRQMTYLKKLQESKLPKLLIATSQALLITAEVVKWAQSNLPNLKVVHIGDGLHYIQEDNPHEIGKAISEWMIENNI